mmetsp:Transcript_32075/g.42529  ORF Transcript_32075/g.42529 Transcript_32075/m.42529 type:complete len:123 (+) Transcript_32075:1362-1730(+)
MDAAQLERFLIDVLPNLDYLEVSSMQLPEEIMHKASEKFKQIVVFGSPDLPHNKRQHLLTKYTINVQMIYARDFPLNFSMSQQSEAETAEAMAAAAKSNGLAPDKNSRALIGASQDGLGLRS